MYKIKKADQRGRSDLGWLQSRFSFSFADYYDPDNMGFSVLRVINDDIIAPEAGFGMHAHENMEIITYVTQGAVAHKDSMGNVEQINAGEIQVMSAGSGVRHSEFNPSKELPLKLLQIWIQPDQFNLPPRYQQQLFESKSGLTLLVSNNEESEGLHILQDVQLSRLQLPAGESQTIPIAGRSAYVHLVSGSARIMNEDLLAGDALELSNETVFKVDANEDLEALVFDLPSHHSNGV